MADDLDELVLKVGVQVDSDQLKKLREELKNMQEKSAKMATKLGFNVSGAGGPTPRAPTGEAAEYSAEVLDVLTNSQKYLMKMFEIMKSDSDKKKRITDEEEKESKGPGLGPIPFVNSVMNSNAGTLAGGAIGGVVGAIAGGNVLAGSQIGAAVGGMIQKMFGVAKDKVEAVATLYDKQITENMQFRQLHQQTGMLVGDLYKLQQQALLAGTSLEKVVGSTQNFVSDLMSGMSPVKAQTLMALNINPMDILFASGGNWAKANQMIFKRANEALKNEDPYVRSQTLSNIGYDPEMQSARRYLYKKNTVDRANKTYNEATNFGKNPIPTGDLLEKQILEWKGAIADFSASIRSALSAGNVAQHLSVELMTIKAQTVTLIADTLNTFGKMPEEKARVERDTDQKIKTINDSVNSNLLQHQMLQKNMHSGYSKVGAPK